MTAVLNDGRDDRLQKHEDKMIHKLAPLVCGSSVVKSFFQKKSTKLYVF